MRTPAKLFLILGVLVILSPLGLLAKGTAWGEWTSHELLSRDGAVPDGLARLEHRWNAILSDYTIPGWTEGWRSAIGYAVSAVLGCALVAGGAFLVSKWLTTRRPKP